MTKELVNFIGTAYKTGMCPLNCLRKETNKDWTATHYVPERPGFTRLSAEGEEDVWVETPHATKLLETLQKFQKLPVTVSEDDISFWLSTLGKEDVNQRPIVVQNFLDENWSGVTLTVKKELVCDGPGSAIPGYVIYFHDTPIVVFVWNPSIKLTLVTPHELRQSQLAAV